MRQYRQACRGKVISFTYSLNFCFKRKTIGIIKGRFASWIVAELSKADSRGNDGRNVKFNSSPRFKIKAAVLDCWGLEEIWILSLLLELAKMMLLNRTQILTNEEMCDTRKCVLMREQFQIPVNGCEWQKAPF